MSRSRMTWSWPSSLLATPWRKSHVTMEKRLFDEPPRIGAVPLLFAVRVSSTAPNSKSHLAAIVCLAVTQQTAALPAWYLRWPAEVTFIITKPAASREIAGWSLRTRFLRRSTARGANQEITHSNWNAYGYIRKIGAFWEAHSKFARHSTRFPPHQVHRRV